MSRTRFSPVRDIYGMLARMKPSSPIEESPAAIAGLGGVANLVAFVGGAGVVVAGLASLGAGRFSGAFVVGSVAWSVGLAVLALGLPGRPGVFGRGLLRRCLIVASAVLSLAVVVVESLSGSLGFLGPASVDSSDFRVLARSLTAADLVALALLVVGAILVGRAGDASSRDRRGLLCLALLRLVSYLVPVGVLLVLTPNDEQGTADGLFWFSRLFALLTSAVGVWFAWPWLSPRVAAGQAAVGRAYRRYVDSTP